MIGLDPALVLCYRDEYKEILGQQRGDFNVLLVNEWLAGIDKPHRINDTEQSKEYTLFNHCTESTARPNSGKEWQNIFANLVFH